MKALARSYIIFVGQDVIMSLRNWQRAAWETRFSRMRNAKHLKILGNGPEYHLILLDPS